MILTVPSYVIPGSYYENIVFLADIEAVQGVELLFFLFDEDTRRLFIREKPQIEPFRSRFHFSTHLPDPLRPEHEEILAICAGLSESYVVHTPESAPGGVSGGDTDRFAALINGWRRRYGERFFLENLIDRDFDGCLERLPDIPICCDIGHLLMRRKDVGRFLDRHGSRIAEVHLHGVRGGSDHRPFGPDEPWIDALVSFLEDYQGILNLELFSISEVREVLQLLESLGLLEPQELQG